MYSNAVLTHCISFLLTYLGLHGLSTYTPQVHRRWVACQSLTGTVQQNQSSSQGSPLITTRAGQSVQVAARVKRACSEWVSLSPSETASSSSSSLIPSWASCPTCSCSPNPHDYTSTRRTTLTKKESGASASPFEHRLHVLNLLARELLELGVGVEDAGRSRSSVALVDVQPAGQFGGQLGGRVAAGCLRLLRFGSDRALFGLRPRFSLLRSGQPRLQLPGQFFRCHAEERTLLSEAVRERGACQSLSEPLSSWPRPTDRTERCFRLHFSQ